jgi:hypothetical protein
MFIGSARGQFRRRFCAGAKAKTLSFRDAQ